MDVEAWLDSYPAWKFARWKLFYELEPPGDVRSEWGFAHVVQALIRDGKTPLSDYKIAFGDEQREARKQTVEYQTRLIEAWISTSNAIFNHA